MQRDVASLSPGHFTPGLPLYAQCGSARPSRLSCEVDHFPVPGAAANRAAPLPSLEPFPHAQSLSVLSCIARLWTVTQSVCRLHHFDAAWSHTSRWNEVPSPAMWWQQGPIASHRPPHSCSEENIFTLTRTPTPQEGSESPENLVSLGLGRHSSELGLQHAHCLLQLDILLIQLLHLDGQCLALPLLAQPRAPRRLPVRLLPPLPLLLPFILRSHQAGFSFDVQLRYSSMHGTAVYVMLSMCIMQAQGAVFLMTSHGM